MQLQGRAEQDCDEVGMLRRQLESLQHEFREFVYRVAHDVNAPMRSVVSFSDLLAKKYGTTALDGRASDYLSYIRKGVQQSQGMLNALLDYSRVDTMSGAPVEVDCNLVVERAQRVLHGPIKREDANIHSAGLPLLIAEPKQLEKVFCLLIENALDHRATATPEISISAVRSEKQWVFSVSDNGIGIPEKQAQEIFQIFRAFHENSTKSGMGMGLALARKIVRRHRGDIWVAPASGPGATLCFSLPADDLLLREGLQ